MSRHEAAFTWDEAATERLRGEIASGKSAAMLAQIFGVSRNAVIGRAYRMGVSVGKGQPAKRASARAWTDDEKRALRENAALGIDALVEKLGRTKQAVFNIAYKCRISIPRKEWPSRPDVSARHRGQGGPKSKWFGAPIQDAPSEGSVDFWGLKFNQCRYPYGEATDLDAMRFCGAPVHEGSWCAGHGRVVYRIGAAK